mmetsp:Transcript_38230/g.53382  ORF Transcript_38230/g.53382 Transcript_38230/m.53382 type:complete len:89 (+) Transcript_38230:39-305(+)
MGILDSHKNTGIKEAENVNLNGRTVTAVKASDMCLESYPCKHSDYRIEFEDGSVERISLRSGAAFAFCIQALGLEDKLDPHFAGYLKR